MANIIPAFLKDKGVETNSAICNNIMKNSHTLCTDVLTIEIIVANVNGGRFYEFCLSLETTIQSTQSY